MRWYKIDRNFACFWPPNFFRGEPPEFLDLHYKIEPDSYRVAKFDGDRPRELGDLALKKKHHEHFISPPVTTVHGRPNYVCVCVEIFVIRGLNSVEILPMNVPTCL